MKVLIIGKDSYIGNHIDRWLSTKGWAVCQLDVMTDEWKSYDYSRYDVIVHVAGIVHCPQCNDWNLYKKVNTDMPITIAAMAKEQGHVKAYVFFSTMAVYGVEKGLRPTIINRTTPLHAESMYGKSKLLAEQGLSRLQDKSFNVVCLRPPSVYGKGCKGNYISGFARVVKKMPVFPVAYQDVRQSMIYIDNLCEFVYQVIVNKLSGGFCPQDEKPVNALEILDAIAEGLSMKRAHSRLLGMGIKLFKFLPIITKAYGGIEYERELSNRAGFDYIMVPFDEGIKRTVL